MRGAAETATVGVCPVGNHEAAKPVTTDRAAVEDATTRGEAPTIVNRGAGARTTTVVVVVADSLGTNRAGVAADRAAVGVDVAAIVAAGRTGAVVVDAVAIVAAGRTGAVVVDAVATVAADRAAVVVDAAVIAATGRTEAVVVDVAAIVAAGRTETGVVDAVATVAADRAAAVVDVAATVAAGRTEAVGVDAVAIPEGDIPPMPRATIAAAIRLAAATSQRVTNSLPAVVAMPGASNHGVDTDDLVDATPRTSRRALPTEEGNGRTPLPPGASPLFWNWTSTTAGA